MSDESVLTSQERYIWRGGYYAGLQDGLRYGSEHEERATLDHVHECYWLIPKPREIRAWLYAWRRRA